MANKIPDANKIAGVIVDHTTKKIAVFSEDILVNQLKRDAPRIEASFDKLCGADVQALSKLASEISLLTYAGLAKAADQNDRLRVQCVELIMNALNTTSAALLCLRAGYVLVPGMLARNVVETLAVVAHLMQNPDDLARFKSGKLASTSTIASAKKVIPVFGYAYGYLSSQYTHIGTLHSSIQPPLPFGERNDALKVNLGIIRAAFWLTYVTTELLFVDSVEAPRYWVLVGKNVAKYDPSEAERAWQKEFLEMEPETASGERPSE